MTEVNKEKAVEQEPKQEEQPQHGDHKHHHAFTDPAEREKKWNDPERDKWQHPKKIVAALAPKLGETVAESGAGTGYMVAPLSKAVGNGGTVIAIDAEAAMVEYLAKRSDDLGPAKIVPRMVVPDDPELQTASVDGVLTPGHMASRQGARGIRQEGVRGTKAVREVRGGGTRGRCGDRPAEGDAARPCERDEATRSSRLSGRGRAWVDATALYGRGA